MWDNSLGRRCRGREWGDHAERELVCSFLTSCFQSLKPWPPCHEELHFEVWAETNLPLFHRFCLGCFHRNTKQPRGPASHSMCRTLWSHTGLWVQISAVLFGGWTAEQSTQPSESWFSPCQMEPRGPEMQLHGRAFAWCMWCPDSATATGQRKY